MANKPEKVVIVNLARGIKHEKKFFQDIQAAILDGYRLPENPNRRTVSMRNFKGNGGRCVLFLEGYDPTIEVEEVKAPEVAVESPKEVKSEDPLAGLTKKVDLLAFAAEKGIEVPDDVTAPMKIKKIIKEALNKQ